MLLIPVSVIALLIALAFSGVDFSAVRVYAALRPDNTAKVTLPGKSATTAAVRVIDGERVRLEIRQDACVESFLYTDQGEKRILSHEGGECAPERVPMARLTGYIHRIKETIFNSDKK